MKIKPDNTDIVPGSYVQLSEFGKVYYGRDLTGRQALTVGRVIEANHPYHVLVDVNGRLSYFDNGTVELTQPPKLLIEEEP